MQPLLARPHLLRVPLLLIAIAAACASGDLDIEDTADGSFSGDGKADGAGIMEGSLQAQGVLALVNDPRTTTSILDNDVGLSTRVSDAIVNYREESARSRPCSNSTPSSMSAS